MSLLETLPIEKITKSPRKTVSLRVTERGTLDIRMPVSMSKSELERFLARHINWINERISRMQRAREFTVKQFVQGEKFLFLGKLYDLQFTEDSKTALELRDKFYLSKSYKHRAREIFEHWYKARAKEYFYKRAFIYSSLMGVRFNNLKLSQAKQRWGSCSSKGNINIVWRLIMAPPWVIDYVIVHELAHLRYMNHSKSFWRLVAKVYPQYKQAIKWLKENGYYLNF